MNSNQQYPQCIGWRKNRSTVRWAVGCALAMLLVGCGQQAPVEAEPAPELEPATAPLVKASSVLDVVQPDEIVLATVNGTRIGEQDLSVNMARTLGDSYLQLADSSVEEKILESMIASRAIATKAFDAMTTDEQVALEKRVARYREELIVKDYLLHSADPHTITSSQIESYYNDNASEFQGQEERLYELVTVTTDAYRRDSKTALDTLQLAKNHDDWRKLSADLKRTNNQLTLAHGYETWQPSNGKEQSAGEKTAITDAINGLKVGQMSRVVIQDGAPYLLRLLEIKQGEPVPLSQARSSIKRKLLPASIRQSVREVSDEVLAKSEVVRLSSAQNSQ